MYTFLVGLVVGVIATIVVLCLCLAVFLLADIQKEKGEIEFPDEWEM
ncbi:MAG: hypothetical protein WDZ73_00765 [Candidatus Paceibacterota bacterium]